MKTYRKALADAFVLRDALEYLARRADDMNEEADSYRERAGEADTEFDKDYCLRNFSECNAYAAAFERLIEKLSK